jgi:hypothetical protein
MTSKGGKITARWPDRQAGIAVRHHPTDSLLTCEECGETCAGDVKAMADFVTKHTERHKSEHA